MPAGTTLNPCWANPEIHAGPTANPRGANMPFMVSGSQPTGPKPYPCPDYPRSTPANIQLSRGAIPFMRVNHQVARG